MEGSISEASTDRLPDLRIYGINGKLKKEIINISKNLGIGISDFLKPKLKEISDSYPAHMKEAPKQD
jgi:hypothetical protein